MTDFSARTHLALLVLLCVVAALIIVLTSWMWPVFVVGGAIGNQLVSTWRATRRERAQT
jgi:Flp pilus assembly protein TadB